MIAQDIYIRKLNNIYVFSRRNNLFETTSTTKPLTRVGGSALVVGDKWYNPSTGAEAFWNGTYWLSSNGGSIYGGYTFVNSGDPFSLQPNLSGGGDLFTGIFVESLNIVYSYKSVNGGTTNSTNYWRLNFIFRGARNQVNNGHANYNNDFDLNSIAYPLPVANTNTYISIPINQFYSLQDIRATLAQAVHVGAPTIALEASFNLVIKGVM